MCNHIRPFLLVFPCVALHWPISQQCSRSSCTFPSCFQTQSWSWWMDRHGLQVHGWGRRWRTPNNGLGWTLFSILLRVPGLRLTSRCSQGSGDNILSAPAKVPWISDSWVCFFRLELISKNAKKPTPMLSMCLVFSLDGFFLATPVLGSSLCPSYSIHIHTSWLDSGFKTRVRTGYGWKTPVIPALGRLRQENHGLKVSLSY